MRRIIANRSLVDAKVCLLHALLCNRIALDFHSSLRLTEEVLAPLCQSQEKK